MPPCTRPLYMHPCTRAVAHSHRISFLAAFNQHLKLSPPHTTLTEPSLGSDEPHTTSQRLGVAVTGLMKAGSPRETDANARVPAHPIHQIFRRRSITPANRMAGRGMDARRGDDSHRHLAAEHAIAEHAIGEAEAAHRATLREHAIAEAAAAAEAEFRTALAEGRSAAHAIDEAAVCIRVNSYEFGYRLANFTILHVVLFWGQTDINVSPFPPKPPQPP
jgi:hypothetical protein